MPDPYAYLLPLIGGLLIGLSAALLLLVTGRIAGVSGLLAAATRIADSGPPMGHAAAFVLGLPAGALLIGLSFGMPEVRITSSLPLLIGAGLLVGFGTRLGNGCTSGHGVCGMARLSIRSIAATITFMASGFATVFVMRHVIGG